MIDSIKKLYWLLNRKERFSAAILLVLMIAGSVLEVVGIAAIPAFIALFGEPEQATRYPYVEAVFTWLSFNSPGEVLFYAGVALLGIFIFKNLYLAFLSYFKATFIYNRQYRIGKRLFAAYLNSSYNYHLQRNTSELLRNVKDNVLDLLTRCVLIPLITLTMEVITLVFIFGFLLAVEPGVSIVAISLLGTSSIVFLLAIKKKNAAYGLEEQLQRRNLIQTVNQGLGGLKEALVLGRQNFFVNEFAESAARFVRAAKFRRITAELPKPFMETFAISGMLLMVVLFLTRGGDMHQITPTLALFGAAAIRLMPSLKLSISSYNTIRYYKHVLDQVHDDLIGLERKSGGHVPTLILPGEPFALRNKLELRELWYRYPEAQADAIKGISLGIAKGSVVGFVGPSGAGKTTMVDLILGLLPPTRGEILVDGKNIEENMRGWRQNIGYIPQSIYLSDDTIRRNIAYGLCSEEIDDNMIWQAVIAAQLEQFVTSLPKQLDSLVGERGVRISGGERQRIGIARALYHNPEVLIMDEATAALDNQTELHFIKALEDLRSNHTMIMIAHRLSTVRNCDQLYFMKDGTVQVAGSYEKLLEESPDFQAMAAFG